MSETENMPDYPTNAEQWRAAIAEGTGLDPAAGRLAFAAGALPHGHVQDWIERSFGAEHGFHPDFVPALTRNLGGLPAWVYGDGAEPYWPGSDGEV